jgi:predicted CXXCH cytochrome family protein
VSARAAASALLAALALAAAAGAARAASIVDTRHNLSASGPGPIRAQAETRVCVFCHTPHNAEPKTPLWNREVGARTYRLYADPGSLDATPLQPQGPSRLCLSCHDGMIALGSVLRPAAGIAMTGEIPPGSPANVGALADLSAEHPLSLSYDEASGADPQIRPAAPADLLFYNPGRFIECPTCHDAHKDLYPSPDRSGRRTGKFLAAENRYSALCTSCHDIAGWIGSAHQQSPAPIDATAFPVAPREWPTWTTVAEWGCEGCHASHASGSRQLLLYRQTEAETCALCHAASTGSPHSAPAAGRGAGILAQTAKLSAHRMGLDQPVAVRARVRGAAAAAAADVENVTCSDCHNPHVAAARRGAPAAGGGIAGSLRGVSGTDAAGRALPAASREYEICFKCHGDRTARAPFVLRVVTTTNARLQFDTGNPSFHPVVGPGRNHAVPSIPSPLAPGLTVSSLVLCSDCHGDDNGTTRGPHGSSYPPILKERYETGDHTVEGLRTYALCYGCHDRTSILGDAGFRRRAGRGAAGGGGHSGHLADGAPCSACHDAHGVPPAPGTGDHEHLINFDTTIVLPAPGRRVPLYRNRGAGTGSCTLLCHGRAHVEEAYP